MRRAIKVCGIVVGLACGIVLHAQSQTPSSYTVGVWLSTATDPNTTAPISTAQYPVSEVTCGQARLPGNAGVVNPDEGRFDDPANAALDCVVSIAVQVRTMPSGKYKAALRVNGRTESSAYGPMSDIFERQGPPPAPSVARIR